jgi:hypothetical protein
VDLAPLIFSKKIFAPLRDDEPLFRTVHVVEDGAAIAWGVGGEIDMAATTIESLADEIMTPADFAEFLRRNGLSLDSAAAQLGISRRLVGYYAKERAIPRYIALACAIWKGRRPAQTFHAGTSDSSRGAVDAPVWENDIIARGKRSRCKSTCPFLLSTVGLASGAGRAGSRPRFPPPTVLAQIL